MLNVVKLTPPDIVKFRDVVLHSIKESLPPTFSGDGEESESRFYQALLSDLMQAWIFTDGDVLKCVCVTMISGDQFSMDKDLLIYGLYGLGDMDQNTVEYGMDVLGRYAKALGCQRLSLYTEHDNMISVLTNITGVDPLITNYVSFDVDELTSPKNAVIQEIGA